MFTIEVGMIYKGRETGMCEERKENREFKDVWIAKTFLKSSEPVKIIPHPPNSPYFKFVDHVGIYMYTD